MTVVVGVDGSEPSRVALRLAAQEAHCRQVPLVAVSAYEPPLGTPSGGFPVAALHTDEEERATAESALRDTVHKDSVTRRDRQTYAFRQDLPDASSSRRPARRMPS